MKPFHQTIIKNKNILMFIVSILLIILPGIVNNAIVSRLLMNLMLTTLFLISLYAYGSSKKIRFYLGIGLVSLTVIVTWFPFSTITRFDDLIKFIVFVFVISTIGKLMLNYLIKSTTITLDVIFAAINIYVFSGIIFGFLVMTFSILYPGSYQYSKPMETYDFIYYAFITLCSIGYGDILPAIRQTKMLSIIISISGQIYLSVVVALLVGKYLVHKDNEAKTL